jgi:hypothetical protein
MTMKTKESFWAVPPVKINSSFTCALCKKELEPFNVAKLSDDGGLAHLLCIPKAEL